MYDHGPHVLCTQALVGGAEGVGGASWFVRPISSAQSGVKRLQGRAAEADNLAQHMERPERVCASLEMPLASCMLHRNVIRTAPTAEGGRQVQGRLLKVHRRTAVDEVRGSYIEFVSRAKKREFVPMLRSPGGQPVLSVSDSCGFIDDSETIRIARGIGRLQLEIDCSVPGLALRNTGVSLLRLARILSDLKGRELTCASAICL